MLKTTHVYVELTSRNTKRYESLGYHIPRTPSNNNRMIVKRGTKVYVAVEDLPSGSPMPVEASCDHCGASKVMPYRMYLLCSEKHDGDYYCNKCSNIYTGKMLSLPWDEVLARADAIGLKVVGGVDTYENTSSEIRYICNKHQEAGEFSIIVQSLLKQKGCPECWRERNSFFNTGERNSNYNPDLSDEHRRYNREVLRSNSDITSWRKSVFEQDNYVCQCCGRVGGELRAHHKDGYNWCIERRYDVSNGATLCKKCHKAFHLVYGKGDNTESQYEEWIKNYNKQLAI